MGDKVFDIKGVIDATAFGDTTKIYLTPYKYFAITDQTVDKLYRKPWHILLETNEIKNGRNVTAICGRNMHQQNWEVIGSPWFMAAGYQFCPSCLIEFASQQGDS